MSNFLRMLEERLLPFIEPKDTMKRAGKPSGETVIKRERPSEAYEDSLKDAVVQPLPLVASHRDRQPVPRGKPRLTMGTLEEDLQEGVQQSDG
ncbi:hypothetical protein NDU88_000738 [Pleurodeles waltl]|uniref:Uncharacterized protein n=1 Tax=Pleurodeles waltl TaxID=8319 RepID=A0AAV7KYN6_PLEWA|nr:hypothetical protein NDU88_000738 [Pleurodeles waltl]